MGVVLMLYKLTGLFVFEFLMDSGKQGKDAFNTWDINKAQHALPCRVMCLILALPSAGHSRLALDGVWGFAELEESEFIF